MPYALVSASGGVVAWAESEGSRHLLVAYNHVSHRPTIGGESKPVWLKLTHAFASTLPSVESRLTSNIAYYSKSDTYGSPMSGHRLRVIDRRIVMVFPSYRRISFLRVLCKRVRNGRVPPDLFV
jgi:hypothetical protein